MIVLIFSTMSRIADALFSKAQQRVLALFFGRPDEAFHVNQIIRDSGLGSASVQRELARLEASGLIVSERTGNLRQYRASHSSPVFEELSAIVRKTFGVSDVLRDALDPVGERVKVAFIYGSVAKATDMATSDIDLLIVGDDLPYGEVLALSQAAEQRLGRKMNPTVYTTEEFRRRVDDQNHFLTRVLVQPKIFVKGSEDDIPAIGESGKDRKTQSGAVKPRRVRSTSRVGQKAS
jgi:predicted nucleotidyltransferase